VDQASPAGTPASAPADRDAYDHAKGAHYAYLLPGDLIGSKKPIVARTVLGSCVAVCMWDPITAAAGLCHYLLPTWSRVGLPSAQYGDVALSELTEKLLHLGAERAHLRAKVYGGACMLQAFHARPDHIGTQNISVALHTLSALGIPIVDQRVGGVKGMKITFDFGTAQSTVALI
jgi:chemotaxis protein CheD